jgi:drug/metabolite transporter (DMT)-like permease
MLFISLAIITCVVANVLIRYSQQHYTYNVSSVLLSVECTKLILCACVMRYIQPTQRFKIRWGFIVNAGLYSVVNFLVYKITSIMEPSIYSALYQHKLVWIVLFSSYLFKRTYSPRQYISLIAVCIGCAGMKLSDTSGVIRPQAIVLILVQGMCSSLSAVWIEKMMKKKARPKVTEDESLQKLYWFLSDSFQMYMFGIPIYIFGAFAQSVDRHSDMPFAMFASLVGIGVIEGLSLGAVFVYHSSIVRALVAAIVIVLLTIIHGVYSLRVISGVFLVVSGVIGWTWNKKNPASVSKNPASVSKTVLKQSVV